MQIVKNPLTFLKQDFQTESNLCDYLELNIKLFCIQCLGLHYVTHTREFPLLSHRRKAKRIDFLIETQSGMVIVECKNPIHICEVHNAVGQILNYETLLKEYHQKDAHRLIIVTTKYDPEVNLTIKQFNLPVHLIGLDKEHHLLSDISHLN